MAISWILIVLLAIKTAQPQCFFCSKECLKVSNNSYKEFKKPLSLYCNSTSYETFNFTTNQYEMIYKISIKASLQNLNTDFSSFTNLTVLDLSSNELGVFNTSSFQNVQILDLSYNYIRLFCVNQTQLTTIDLSHNLLENLSESDFQLPFLLRLNLSSNLITNLENFTSDKLKYLDLANNKIKYLTFGSLVRLKSLDVSNNAINDIGNNLFSTLPNLEVLNLSYNLIQELRDSNFKLQSLLKLDLRGNKIYSLSQKCFYGLNKLQFLDVSMNKIETISPNTLQYLPSLVHLFVSDNKRLSSKDFGLLLATRRLQHVDASKTNLNKIPSSLTRSVRYLRLHSNIISDIQCGDLDSYPLLNILDLSSNNISYIEDDSLGRLELLMTLVLSNNSLFSVPHTLPANLKNLYLDFNKIKHISNIDFMGLTQLKKLDLAFNEISDFHDGSFFQLKVLEFLNISGNPTQILSSSTFLGTQKLTILDLSKLHKVKECVESICFPIPESNQLQELYLQFSEVLVNRLMNDVAALKTLRQLSILDLSDSNLTLIRDDLLNFLPRISIIHVEGNNINCSQSAALLPLLQANLTEECSLPKQNSTMITDNDNFENHTESSTTLIFQTTEIQSTETSLKSIYTEANVKNKTYITLNNTFESLSLYDNFSEISNSTENADRYLNELWFKDSKAGSMYAFSSEMPISHPGLFIMLLLPLALVATVLVINYSRMKNNARNYEMVYGPDIEIASFSNELW